MPQNVFEYKDFFKLIVGGVETFVDEPLGFDKAIITLKRDADYYGFNYEFIDDKTTLEFVEGNGYELLRQVYEDFGSDGKVVLQFGYIDPVSGEQRVQFTGTCNLNDITIGEKSATMPAEKQAFENLLRTRIDTKFALNADKSLDDVTIVPPTPLYMRLHSKRLIKMSKAETKEPDVKMGTFDDMRPTPAFIQLDTQNTTVTELDEVQNMPSAMVGFPPSESLFQFKAAEAGETTISFEFNGSFGGVHTLSGDSTQSMSRMEVRPYFCVVRPADGIITLQYGDITTETKSPPSGGMFMNYNSGVVSFLYDLEVGDEVYFGFEAKAFNSGGTACYWWIWQIITNSSSVTITQNTKAPDTYSNAWNFFDALRQVVAGITNEQNAVESAFFGVGGYAEKFAITNGFQIRNFQIADRPPQVALKDLLECASAIWNIGVGFKTLPNGKEVLVIEPMDFYYAGKGEILRIDELFDYQENHAKDKVFNEIEIGFEKFGEDDLNTMDDYSTYHTYLTPIKTFKARKTIRSKIVASGYVLENQRREQFKENPSTSLGGDDTIFIINYVQGTRNYLQAEFSVVGRASAKYVHFFKVFNLQVGDQFYINGSSGNNSNNGILYTVTAVREDEFELYTVSPLPLLDRGTANINVVLQAPPEIPAGQQYAAAARDEEFLSISGVLSPETAYNLKITPKRMLYNWMTFFNIGFWKKTQNDVIKNTFVKANKDLTTLLPWVGLNDPRLLREGDDILLRNYSIPIMPWRQVMPHRPIRVSFKTRMKYDDVLELKKYLRGEGLSGDPRNYGYIVIYDMDNVPWRVHVEKITYNPAEELANFDCFKIWVL